jgi:hypothetical protein
LKAANPWKLTDQIFSIMLKYMDIQKSFGGREIASLEIACNVGLWLQASNE